MGKKENHKRDLLALINTYIEKGDEKPLINYFVLNSNLPSRRANLEMAAAFVEVIEESYLNNLDEIWNFCIKAIGISEDKAPTNNPMEIVPFCGSWGIGLIGSISESYFQEAVLLLREGANDPRWRIREAVAFGIQKILERRSQVMLQELSGWVDQDNWLEMRAIAAGVAHPKILAEYENANSALELHKSIFGKIKTANDRRSEDFKTLRKGLGYTLSVVVSNIPDEGFQEMKELIKTQDHDLLWIIKNNLKKKRLTDTFPSEVKVLNKLL
ncbi:MAG: HEAT repeat domain-containing protein [Candidatus Hodarchaeota archaeon]